jgi:hypothetical protein
MTEKHTDAIYRRNVVYCLAGKWKYDRKIVSAGLVSFFITWKSMLLKSKTKKAGDFRMPEGQHRRCGTDPTDRPAKTRHQSEIRTDAGSHEKPVWAVGVP